MRPRDRADGYEPDRPAPVDPWAQPEVRAELEARASRSRLDSIAMDGFKNELTGIGDFSRDKALGGRRGGLSFEVNFISHVAAEDRWRGSDLGGRLIETVPDEMTREGWDVSVQPSDEDEEPDPKETKDAWLAACVQDRSLAAGRWEQIADHWRRRDQRDFADAIGRIAHRWRTDEFPAGGPPPDLMAPPAPAGLKPVEVDDEGAEIAEAVDGKLEELDALQVIWEALAYERAYGGAAILIGAQDGSEDLSKPLDEDRVEDVTHLTAFSGGWDGELVSWSWYRDVAGKNYGKPETYMLRNLGVPIARLPVPGEAPTREVLPPDHGVGYGPLITWVHESRLLVFPGTAVSRRARVQMRGWGDSLFTRVDDVLQQYSQTWGAVANLMTDFAQGVLKIKNLAQALAANNKNPTNVVSTRGRALNLGRSVAGLMMLDSEEDFRREMASLAGLPEVLQQFALRLAAAADMPVSLLMGQAPAGLNATGDSEIRWFYDRVASKQKKRMMPQLKRLISILLKSKNGPSDGAEPARWSAAARPLYQMTATEKADRYAKIATADATYITQGVVTPEEVAATRFGGSEYSDGPVQIDIEGRQEMAAQAEADAEEFKRRAEEMHQAKVEAAKNPPPPATGAGEEAQGEAPTATEEKPAEEPQEKETKGEG